MIKIQNVSKQDQSIRWIQKFKAWEIRAVNDQELRRLINNPNFELVKTKQKEDPVLKELK